MADKDVMKAIGDHIKDRVHLLNEAFAGSVAVNGQPVAGLAAVFRALEGSYRDEANLWTNSKSKGWQSTSTDLRKAAARVAEVATALDKLAGEPATAPKREPTELSHATNGNLVYRPEPYIDPSRARLEACPRFGEHGLIESCGLCDPGKVPVPEAPVIGSNETLAYLRGDTDDPNIVPRADMPGASIDQQAQADAGQPDLHEEARQMTQTFPIPPSILAEDPFSDPKPPAWSGGAGRYVPSGGRQLTFIDLMTPPPVHLVPQHWSWSQLSASEDCGVQYRMSRIENLTQIPQWANIGGDAFHKATQWIDEARSVGVVRHDVPETWEKAFGEAVAAIASTSPVPIDKWRAASGGKEGQDWWRVEGERMLSQFVEQRQKLAAAANPRTIALLPHPMGSMHGPIPDDRNHALAIEWPFTITIDGPMGPLMFANIIDRVWQCSDGTLLIEDLKSGSRMPQDTTQLGAYAWGVAQTVPYLRGYTPDGITTRIMGTFYDARKGVWTPAVDLLAAHPWEELVYRVHSAEAKRRAGLYTPHVSNFCTSCSVQYACPLRNREGSGGPS